MDIHIDSLVPLERLRSNPDEVLDRVRVRGMVVLLENNMPVFIITECGETGEKTGIPVVSLRAEMTLHQAMIQVLMEAPDHTMHASDLADEIYRRRLYVKQNGKKAEYTQVRARCSHYPELFVALSGNFIKIRSADDTLESPAAGRSQVASSKYRPISEHLADSEREHMTMSYTEMEALVGAPLPKSAYKHRQWWANGGGHAQANAWLAAGYKVDSVVLGRSVTFSRR